MTGADLIKWIEENKAEKLEVMTDTGYFIYPAKQIVKVTSNSDGKEYIFIGQ